MFGSKNSNRPAITSRYKLPASLTRPEEKLLLINGRIIDVEKGKLRKEKKILIQNGRIQGLFQTRTKVDADREVNLNGDYILPGLMNAHCHMTAPGGVGLGLGNFLHYKRQLERNAEECIKHGVTTVRDMLGFSGWLGELKNKIAHGQVVGPRILESCALDVEKGYGESMAVFRKPRYFKPVSSPAEGKNAVKAALDHGADHIKIFQQPVTLLLPRKPIPVMDLSTIKSICEEAEKRGKPVAMHQTRIAGFRKGLDGAVPSLEHMPRDEEATEEDIRQLQELGSWMIPTLSASLGLAHNRKGDPFWGKGHLPEWTKWRRTHLFDLIEEFCEPVFVKSSIDSFGRFADPTTYEKWHLTPWPDQEQFTASLTIGATNAKLFYDAGIPLGCGNDGGVPLVWPGSMGVEMMLCEQIGMKPADVLCMATLNNARLFRLDKDLGSIEKGKTADLNIYKDNPLDTVQNIMRPVMVFMEGRRVFDSLQNT